MAGGVMLGLGAGLLACGGEEETFCDLQVALQHGDRSTDVVFSPDGKLLASTSWDRTIKISDPKTGELVRSIEGIVDDGEEVAFRADGKVLAAADSSGVKLVDVSSGELIRETEIGRNLVQGLEFSPDGSLLAVGSWTSDDVKIVDGESGKEVARLIGHERGGRSVAFSPDGKLLATTSDDGTVRLWDMKTMSEVRVLPVGVATRGVDFSPDGKLLAVGTVGEGAVVVWDAGGWGVRYSIAVDSGAETRSGLFRGVNEIDFSSDGGLLATVGFDGRVRLWDPATGTDLGLATAHEDQAMAVRFSPDGKILASAGFTGEVVVVGVCP